MVNKKNDSKNEQIDDNEIVAEKSVKKTAKAAPKTTKTASEKPAAKSTEKPARKPAAKKPAASKTAADVETDAETNEPAVAKKPAARRSSKAAKPAAEGETSAEATAPAAPASSFGLMFMAPDLPTPVVDPKKGHIIDQPAADGESHLRRRSRRRAGESVDGELAPNTVVKVREPRAPKEPSNEP